MSAVAIGSRSAQYSEDDEDAPCLGGDSASAGRPVKSTATGPSPWQTLTLVMGFNLLLTLGALGSQATLLLKVSPVVNVVMDLQAKVTGMQATSSSQSQLRGPEQSPENLDLILEKLDTVKSQMVSAEQIDALKAQIANPPPAAGPGAEDDDDHAEQAERVPSPDVGSADAVQAPPAPPTGFRRPNVPNDDYGQILVYNGKLKTLGHKGQLHSQFGQDWFISSVLGCPTGGFFIDIAANDAMVLSNTLMLERDFGWKGICLEANREYIYGLARRKCQTVLAAIGAPKNTKVEFALRSELGGIIGSGFDNKNKSTKSERVDLYLVEFAEVLEMLQAPTTIDYMSLDVEGAEGVVMETFPFAKHTIKLMNIERPKKELQEMLTSHGYQKLRENKNGDAFWIHKTFPNLNKVIEEWGTRGKFPASTCMDAKGYPRPHGLT